MKKIIFIIFMIGISLAQQVYEVPIGSEKNTIGFEIENTRGTQLEELVILAEEIPGWIKLDREAEYINVIDKNVFVGFNFNVDKGAVIGTPGRLVFKVVHNNKSIADKIINLEAGVPKEYRLGQNYPNPFNPETTIEYQLPAATAVKLKIFNLLGEEVVELVNKKQEAGIHEAKFNARQLASGMYVYKLITENKVLTKKMLLMK